MLNGVGPYLSEIIGGSADLTGSNNTKWDDSTPITAADAGGNYLYYGVREFGMAAIMQRPRPARAVSCPTAGRSWCSRTMPATPCAWPR
ncbi:MAG: hypothetical protein U5L11_14955 [Arhodomonas sp.]|nr:hypothetical protein [Arhodomonas sp.]